MPAENATGDFESEDMVLEAHAPSVDEQLLQGQGYCSVPAMVTEAADVDMGDFRDVNELMLIGRDRYVCTLVETDDGIQMVANSCLLCSWRP